MYILKSYQKLPCVRYVLYVRPVFFNKKIFLKINELKSHFHTSRNTDYDKGATKALIYEVTCTVQSLTERSVLNEIFNINEGLGLEHTEVVYCDMDTEIRLFIAFFRCFTQGKIWKRTHI